MTSTNFTNQQSLTSIIHNASQLNPITKNIKSYVCRGGRLSKAQKYAIDNLSDLIIIPFNNHQLNWSKIFNRTAPIKLEIGFGMGESTLHIAKIEPHINFIAIDVHTPGIGKLINNLVKEKIENVKLICHDAVDVLNTMIADSSLEAVHIFFPDPWPKKKHNKRRLIQKNFVILLAKKIQSGGYIHCATDWMPYAEHILNTFNANPFFSSISLPNFAKPSYRPNTKFELRGIKLGHQIQDLIFQRK